MDRLGSQRPSVLEIGCASGNLLLALRSAGFGSLAGCDLSRACVAHLENLGEGLQRVRGLLKPGGWLYVQVPSAIYFNHGPPAPYQEFSNEHIVFFTAGTLAWTLGRSGFRLEAWRGGAAGLFCMADLGCRIAIEGLLRDAGITNLYCALD